MLLVRDSGGETVEPFLDAYAGEGEPCCVWVENERGMIVAMRRDIMSVVVR